MEKLDFSKTHKDAYSAGRKIKRVDIGNGTYLAVPGQGAPGGEAFQNAVGQLYGVAYTLKFAHKTLGDFDFKVSKLECLWDIDSPEEAPVDEWRWRLLIRIPDDIGETEVEKTKTGLKQEKGQDARR